MSNNNAANFQYDSNVNVAAINISGNAATVTTNANLNGEVTSVGNTTTIANNAVTYAKLQPMSTGNRLLGNLNSGTTIGEVQIGGGLTFTGSGFGTLTTQALTGDVTSPAGSFVTTLATVNSAPGTYGSATQVPVFAVNGQGLVTSVTNTTITGTAPGGTAGGDLTGSYPNPLIGVNKVTNAQLRQSAGLSVIGNSTSTLANVADITAGSDNQVLRRSGSALGFGSINLASTSAVTNTLAQGNGGTNNGSGFNSNGIVYQNSGNNAFLTSNAFTYNGVDAVTLNGSNTRSFSISTTTSNAEATINLERNTTSGYSQIHYKTGATEDWATGTRAGGSGYNFFYNNTSVLMSLSTTGSLNIPALTLSQLIATDGSKNLISGNLTGDVTSSQFATTLATVNASPGTFSNVAQTPIIAVNGKGLTTSVTGQNIQIAESQVTNLVSDLAGKISTTLPSAQILVGNGSNVATPVAASGALTINNTGVFTLATVNGAPGTYGSATQVPVFAVNGQGLVTSVTNTTITGTAPGGTAGGDLTGSYPNPLIGVNKVTNAQLRQSAGLSVIGNSTNATANVADITAASDNQVLRRSGTTLGFGSINLSQSNTVGSSILPIANGGTNNNATPVTEGVVYFDGAKFNTTSFVLMSNSGIFLGNAVYGFQSNLNQDRYYLLNHTGGSKIASSGVGTTYSFDNYAGLLTGAGGGPNTGQFTWSTVDATGVAWATRMTLSNAGLLNIAGLTASKIVLTDGSKNLSSSSAGIGAQVTNGMVIYDGTNFVSYASITGTPNQINVVADNPGGAEVIIADQKSNTANSNAILRARVGGTSAGDPHTRYTVTNGTDWVSGIDTSDSLAYLISNGLNVGSGNRLRIDTSGTVSIYGNLVVSPSVVTAPTPAYTLNLNSSTQLNARLVLSGQEYFQAANTSTDGIAFLSGVNRVGNRQLWIADSAALTQNSTNKTIRIQPNSGQIDAMATNGTTQLPLQIGQSGAATTVAGNSITLTGGDVTDASGDFIINTAGKTLKIKQGVNAAAGVGATMVSGVVTVNTTAAATGDIILVTKTASGGTVATGMPVVTISNNVSFTLTAGNGLDGATYSWFIVKPA